MSAHRWWGTEVDALLQEMHLGAVHRHTAEVGVIAAAQRRAGVVLLRLHLAGDHRVHAVRADHDARPLLNRCPALAMAADTDHGVLLPDHVLHDKPVAQLRPGRDRGVDEHRVQRGAPRAEGEIDPLVDRHALETDATTLEVERFDRRRIGGEHTLQHAPFPQLGHAWLVDVMRGEDIARERVPVYEQYPIAASGEQHRRGRPRAARADDNGVVHRTLLPDLVRTCGGVCRKEPSTSFVLGYRCHQADRADARRPRIRPRCGGRALTLFPPARARARGRTKTFTVHGSGWPSGARPDEGRSPAAPVDSSPGAP